METPRYEGSLDNDSAHALLSRALARVRNGRLPRESSPGVLAGPGQNRHCAVCDRPVAFSAVEYEMTSTQTDGSTRAYYFHIPCYHAWQQACHAPADADGA